MISHDVHELAHAALTCGQICVNEMTDWLLCVQQRQEGFVRRTAAAAVSRAV